jgi:two-component system KDP operon response regulator KdpE
MYRSDSGIGAATMVNRPSVLVANPDPGIRRLLRRRFGNAGYSVITAELGRAALDQIWRSTPDVIILSLEMGDLEGVDLVSSVHAATGAPLLVLTPASRSATPSAILDAGADDCMDEPFLLEELAARIRRLLHRAGADIAPKVLITGLGRLEISSLKRIVSLRGVPLALTRREFDLLAVLARANGGVVSHGEILREVWGARGDATRQNLSRVIGSLRRKIEPEPEQPTCLISLQGSGYRLRAQQEPGERG